MKQKSPKSKKTNVLQIILNILIWGFIFAIPFLMFWKNEEVNFTRIIFFHGITVLASILVFYVNYFVLTEKYLFSKKTFKFIILNILLILGIGLILYYMKEVYMDFSEDQHRPEIAHRIFFYFREVMAMITMAGLSLLVKLLTKWYNTEAERQEEEKRRKEAELLNLRQQINPHFFFNTLNNIYALIAISPDKAQSIVLELSKLMRYVLYDNSNNYVAVYKELDFIRNYIELMRIRLTDNVEVIAEVKTPANREKLIAPMMFISLIENAFKHGVSHVAPSFIHIDIHQTEGHIVCLIRNSHFPKNENDKSGSGIGLENLQRRLEILYPNQHIFRTEIKENVYICELTIPLK